ncbi:MAG: tRNA 2-thiouridine(34) synthase MnmA [Gammaproteobacteria bacterium]|nr:tRNA 2-thiouridine(34) synthase MnmA [Gammaproteobacteria bacterium]
MVGMSGGVDSSVAALLLQQQGYDISGVFMKNWEDFDATSPCPAAIDAVDAARVCDILDIPFEGINFARQYREQVFSHFLAEYQAGRTPNPDILCNTEIKFSAFLDHALAQGADRIATGHYARIDEVNGRFRLLKAIDRNKDQSYFLHGLNQQQLSRALFPLGALQKHAVRQLALAAGFANHAKKDSTGICFIGEKHFTEFLGRYLPAQPGDMRSPEGEYLGAHHGLMYHTIGQRKGLGIGGRRGDSGQPWFVAGKNLATNTLIVAQGEGHPLLFANSLVTGTLHWISGQAPTLPLQATAKIRYRQDDQPCTLHQLDNGAVWMEFSVPQRAVTPGQSVVIYNGDDCLGGGVILASDHPLDQENFCALRRGAPASSAAMNILPTTQAMSARR